MEARKAKYNTELGRRERSKRDRRLPQELYNPDAPQLATSRYPRKMERKSDVAVGREIKRRAVGGSIHLNDTFNDNHAGSGDREISNCEATEDTTMSRHSHMVALQAAAIVCRAGTQC